MRQDRFDYPVWGDSIAIPIFQESIAYVILGIVGLIILLPILAFVKFPAPLWNWSSSHKWFSSIISVVFGIPAVLVLLGLPSGIRRGEFGEIVLLAVLSYLFLSLRAGLIEKKLKSGEI